MSGTNPVGTWLETNYNTMTGTQYPLQIDANMAVAQRVVDQFAPRPAATPNMTIVVDAGSLYNGITLTEVAQQTSSAITAPSGSNKRIDRVVVSASTGTISVITGTPTTGTPTAPAIAAGNIPVAQIGPLTSSTTAIIASLITDERNFWGIPSSGVTAGSYTTANITVGPDGRIITASSGVAGAMTLLSSQTISSSTASVSVTAGINSTYSHYVWEISNLMSVTNGVDAYVTVQQGGSFVSTSYYSNGFYSHSSTLTPITQGNASQFNVTNSNANIGSIAPSLIRFEFWNPSVAENLDVMYECVQNGSNFYYSRSGGFNGQSSATTGIKLTLSSGNIATCIANLYGIT